MKNLVITGASRGIGLELTKIALKDDYRVAAFARHPGTSEGLKALKKSYNDKLEMFPLDVSSENVGDDIKNFLKHWNKVDGLFNNAGIYEATDDQAGFLKSYKTNTVAPYLIFKALLPQLERGHEVKVINTSSLMGSIEDNSSGSSHVYRSSKTALNMLIKGLSIDFPQIINIVIHPGWVKTEMGGSNAPVEVTDSAEGIWKVFLNLNKSDSGKFLNFRGRQLPW